MPRSLFPVPGANVLNYIKTVVVHDGKYINGGHYFVYTRDGPVDSLQAASVVGDDGSLGLEAMRLDDRGRGGGQAPQQQLSEEEKTRQVEERHEASPFHEWSKYEDDKLIARVPWSDIEVSRVPKVGVVWCGVVWG